MKVSKGDIFGLSGLLCSFLTSSGKWPGGSNWLQGSFSVTEKGSGIILLLCKPNLRTSPTEKTSSEGKIHLFYEDILVWYSNNILVLFFSCILTPKSFLKGQISKKLPQHYPFCFRIFFLKIGRGRGDFKGFLHLLDHPTLHLWSCFSHSLSAHMWKQYDKCNTAMCVVQLSYLDTAFN